MNPLRLTGPEAGVIKYDLLTALSVAGLNGSPTLQTSLMRLIAAVTSRYNWRADELSVGQRDLARMWSVNERTVKREIKRLTDAQLLICTRGGVRGRAVTPAGGLRRVMCGCRRAVRGGMLGGGLLRALLLLFEQGVDLELKRSFRRRQPPGWLAAIRVSPVCRPSSWGRAAGCPVVCGAVRGRAAVNIILSSGVAIGDRSL